jgi:hypothetical protein
VKDSHTPQVMKLQLLFCPALLLAVVLDFALHPAVSLSVVVMAAFLISTLPFVGRAMKKDPIISLLSPLLLATRSCAQIIGVSAGIIYARQN